MKVGLVSNAISFKCNKESVFTAAQRAEIRGALSPKNLSDDDIDKYTIMAEKVIDDKVDKLCSYRERLNAEVAKIQAEINSILENKSKLVQQKIIELLTPKSK